MMVSTLHATERSLTLELYFVVHCCFQCPSQVNYYVVCHRFVVGSSGYNLMVFAIDMFVYFCVVLLCFCY